MPFITSFPAMDTAVSRGSSPLGARVSFKNGLPESWRSGSRLPAKSIRFLLQGLTNNSQRKQPTQGARLVTPGTGRQYKLLLSTLKTRRSSKPNHPIKINRQSRYNSSGNCLDPCRSSGARVHFGLTKHLRVTSPRRSSRFGGTSRF